MKTLLFVMPYFIGILLYAQEETLEDFFNISQENLKKYSLTELADLTPSEENLILKMFNHNKEEATKILTTLFSLKFRLVANEEILHWERQKKKEQGEHYQLSADLQDKYQWYKTRTGEELLLEECPQHPNYTLQGKGGSTYDFNGSKIQSITETVDKYNAQPVPSFRFFTAYSKDFGDFTENHRNRQLAIIYNNTILSSPMIQTRIEGEGIISGLTSEEVKSLVSAIQFKSLEMLLDQGTSTDPKPFLFLKSMTTLSLKQAQILSQFQGRMMFLNGITELDDTVAQVLYPIRFQIYATQKVMTQIRHY